MATTERIALRERRPSTGAPIVDIQGSVSPAGISRPKHKRTFTGFGATEIKSVEGLWQASLSQLAVKPAISALLAWGRQAGLITCGGEEANRVYCSFYPGATAKGMDKTPSPRLQEHGRVRNRGGPPCRNHPCPQHVQLRRVRRLLGHQLGLPGSPDSRMEPNSAASDLR